MARVLTVTVASATPLTVLFPADPATPVPAVNASGLSLVAGNRVQVEVRSPQLPKITGRIS